MKKLIIAAVALCTALVAQAATVSWSATNIAKSGDSTAYYAMLIDASSTELTKASDVAEAIIAGKFDGTALWDGAATYSASKSVVAVAAAKKPLAGYDSGSVSYYTIIFDATDVTKATNYLVTSGDTAATGMISDAGALTISQGSQDGKTWTAVPEPTSGLLLLLGMAGLALKRKIA